MWALRKGARHSLTSPNITLALKLTHAPFPQYPTPPKKYSVSLAPLGCPAKVMTKIYIYTHWVAQSLPQSVCRCTFSLQAHSQCA